MVRAIFFCMAIVALSLAAMPLINLYKGISAERMTLEEQYAALDTVETAAGEPSPEDLNDIESAAGGTGEIAPDAGTGSLTGGFSGEAPEGL